MSNLNTLINGFDALSGALVISTVTQAISCGFAVGQSGGKYSPPNGAGPF